MGLRNVGPFSHVLWGISAGFCTIFTGVAAAIAQSDGETGHITIEKAANLSATEAEEIYTRLADLMAKRYSIAGMRVGTQYRGWMRFNSAPYLSETHGNRYVNNYANRLGNAYGSLTKGLRFPAGTVLVKDSFTVTDENKAFPGALFVMEKLSPVASPDTGDWRYVGIYPDGSMIGDTVGFMPDRVRYCHQCHRSRADYDFVFGYRNGKTAE